MPIVPPGSKIFKLRRLDTPIIIDKDHKYYHVCDELRHEPCQLCKNGSIEVAYGQENGIFDIYRFPCTCVHPEGREWWQLAEERLYHTRPVAYTSQKADIPGHVFIHPVHSSGMMSIINKTIKDIIATKTIEDDEELPF